MNSLSRPIIPNSLVNEAFERLFEAIVRGEIKPSERLREAKIAKDMGISRGVVREAMQRLEARKLVVRKPNIGVQVISLSDTDLRELYYTREALEGMAARLAAENMDDKEIKQLQDLIKRHANKDSVRRGRGYYQTEDDDFHSLILHGSKNQRLIHTLHDEIHHLLRLYRYRSSEREGRTQQALEEHKEIVAAISARDGAAAEAAMRRHIANARIKKLVDWQEDGS